MDILSSESNKENALTYQLMKPADVIKVSELVNRVFDEFVAPEYPLTGIEEFQSYTQPTAFLARFQAHHFTLIGMVHDVIAGMIEVRNYNHISLLFVSSEYHRQGVAKKLWCQALQICRANKPELSEVSVNSSSYAVSIYEKLGFHRTGDRQTKNGIAFIPMVLKLSSQESGHCPPYFVNS